MEGTAHDKGNKYCTLRKDLTEAPVANPRPRSLNGADQQS